MATNNVPNLADARAKREGVSTDKELIRRLQCRAEQLRTDHSLRQRSRTVGADILLKFVNTELGHPKKGLAWMSISTLRMRLGGCRRSIQRALKPLEGKYLTIIREKGGFSYYCPIEDGQPLVRSPLMHHLLSGDKTVTGGGDKTVTQSSLSDLPYTEKKEKKEFPAIVVRIEELQRTTSSTIQSTGSIERADPPSSAPPPAAFLALWTARPGRTGDSYERALGEWTKLNAEDRALAVKYMPDFAKGDRKNGSEVKDPDYRTMASTYLKNRLFKKCEEAEATIEECRLGIRSISDEVAKEAYRLLGRSRFYMP